MYKERKDAVEVIVKSSSMQRHPRIQLEWYTDTVEANITLGEDEDAAGWLKHARVDGGN